MYYLIWHYREGFQEALYNTINAVTGTLNFFSVPMLLRTLFWPWHGIMEAYGRGFDATNFFFVFFGNIISRVLGAVMRSVVIALGIAASISATLAGILFVALWLALPILIPALILLGIFFFIA